MSPSSQRRGSRLHRFLIFLFSSILTVLLIWLLGFVLGDLGDFSPPNYQQIEKKYVAKEQTDKLASLAKEKKALENQVAEQREIQAILGQSTQTSRDTMNQLLQMHRFNLDKDVKPTTAEVEALAASESLYLGNQKQFQEANALIAGMSTRRRVLENETRQLNEVLDEARNPAREEFEAERKTHQLKVAAAKLAILVPLFIAAAGVTMRWRGKPYFPIGLSAFTATFVWISTVMHAHFPSDFFKYVAIGVGIAIVLAFLIQTIRRAVAPKLGWLLIQYRDAYNRRLCPICAHPILRGPYKHVAWTAKGPKALAALSAAGGSDSEADEPYTCPSCGTGLYEKCESCGSIRHTLLPFCDSCGDEKAITAEDSSQSEVAPAAS